MSPSNIIFVHKTAGGVGSSTIAMSIADALNENARVLLLDIEGASVNQKGATESQLSVASNLETGDLDKLATSTQALPHGSLLTPGIFGPVAITKNVIKTITKLSKGYDWVVVDVGLISADIHSTQLWALTGCYHLVVSGEGSFTRGDQAVSAIMAQLQETSRESAIRYTYVGDEDMRRSSAMRSIRGTDLIPLIDSTSDAEIQLGIANVVRRIISSLTDVSIAAKEIGEVKTVQPEQDETVASRIERLKGSAAGFKPSKVTSKFRKGEELKDDASKPATSKKARRTRRAS